MQDMHTEFKRAEPRREIRGLMAFDRSVFRPADRFPAEYWRELHSYWLLIGGAKAGCCAFERNLDFQEDQREDGCNAVMRGSLYIATTGIHPRFRSLGLGRLMKSWQICYARQEGFDRIVTNMRARNAAIIALNKELGFKVIRRTPRYYIDPVDTTIVMELHLARGRAG
jgi:ribosomal protein S18 acetylase RimI-like enzyme